ncbi:FAD binding domain-containing protein [Amycolatopsis endophytica]|uniref:CO/xanthine dehydrogenase FAD-binding subunit n=1 Tax=Amycolatopsis endophytica TaxID=860233 RepID=A0A853B6N8_9PSEU|nr:FAD binding domain-containing protein [Amycolatopsis endophytica]NYI90739.1 CO/xanthine dehydrogenase FAD-binding subunit [Amycolatopsis endophytica]
MSTFRTSFPRSADEAADALRRVLAANGTPLVVGGGTLAVPSLSRGELTPTDVVDLGRTGLDRIELTTHAVEIGAQVNYQQLLDSPVVTARLPLLHQLCAGITGGIQIRHQGTVAGALCAARPFSDAPAALVALDAQVFVRSADASRIVPAEKFLRGAEENDLGPGEFVAGIRLPLGERRAGYVKLKFAESSWPIMTAAAMLPGLVVLGGVARVPVRVVLPPRATAADVRAAVAASLESVPSGHRWSDLRAGWDYRRRVAPEIAVRAFIRAEGTPA